MKDLERGSAEVRKGRASRRRGEGCEEDFSLTAEGGRGSEGLEKDAIRYSERRKWKGAP